MENNKIFVTQPYLPSLEEFVSYLEEIWNNKMLTNGGPMHQKLESELCDYLGVPYISLFNNGTNALLTALQCYDLTGEVITTPYSFVATSHALIWNHLTPIFVDIDMDTLNIDPKKIEAAITDKTTAILAVHCYGNPCAVHEIQAIADRYNLKVIYDAAHAFAVQDSNGSILNYGDLSVLSFHATKVFNTFEGGAIISHDLETKQKIDRLKNFGITSEVEVSDIGSNGKMSEINAAFGLVQLKYIDDAIIQRKNIAEKYMKALQNISGIDCALSDEVLQHNYSYFPILIDSQKYGKTRDELYEALKKHNVFARRYFYPLITDFEAYKQCEKRFNLDVASKISNDVLCLPIYPGLADDELLLILRAIKGM